MDKNIKTFLLLAAALWYTVSSFAQLRIIQTSQLSDSFDNSQKNILLFGEQHMGKQRKAIHATWNEIINHCNIDTVFIEHPYSAYLSSKIDFGPKYLNLGPLAFDTTKVLVPVDIEDNVEDALLAIESVYFKNELNGSEWYLKNKILRKTIKQKGTYNQKEMLEYLKEVRLKVVPSIKYYKPEFMKLLDNMEQTYSVFKPDELAKAPVSAKRDSLMALEIAEYIQTNHVYRWAGLFGAYHLTIETDHVYDVEMDLTGNLLNRLINEQKVLSDRKDVFRVLYRSINSIDDSDSMIRHGFISKYGDHYSELHSKGDLIIDFHDDVWFWITKK